MKANLKYYRVEEGPCHEILTRWRSRREAIKDQYFTLVKELGGVGFYPGHDDNVINALPISGVIFEGDLPHGWKPRSWKSHNSPGESKSIGWPDARSKVGKAALASIKRLPLLPSTDGPCDEIGFPSSLEYSGNGTVRGVTRMGAFTTLVVGWLEQKFYVALPDEARARAELEASGYAVEGTPWQPLPGMIEILEEEMRLDYARAAASSEGGAK